MTEIISTQSELHIIHKWGIEVIGFVQNFANPVLTEIIKIFTDASTYGFVVFVIGLYLWCIDYKKGLHLAYAAAFSSGLNGGIKRIFKIPRPYIHSPEIMLKSVKDFSTPSGHSFISALMYPAVLFYNSLNGNKTIADTPKRKTLKIILAILLPFLVGFSRVYLGVHYPTDVLLGWLLGVITFLSLMFLTPRLEAKLSVLNKNYENAKIKNIKTKKFTFAASLSFILILISKEKVQEAGIILGLAFGNIRILENSKYRFDAASGNLLQKLIRFVLGAALSSIPILIYYILKIDTGHTQFRLYTFLEFFAVGVIASGIAPIIFRILNLAGETNADR